MPERDPEMGSRSMMARKSKSPASKLHLEVLPTAQRKLWDELGSTPDQFVLYGGTAIALRLGHRQSVDFDFFSRESIDPAMLLRTVAYLERATVQQLEPQTLVCRVIRGKPVSVSFFGLPTLRRIASPDVVEAPRVQLASLLDLAGTKMAVIARRARAKDYLDVHALLTRASIELLDALAAARVIYGEQFSPLVSLKALTYFGEPELGKLPTSVKRDLEAAVGSVDRADIPERVSHFERSAS
jgi:hypothetical protein